MAIERQVSFAAGELAPTLWGRNDFAAYPIGARRLYNFFVSPHGIAMNRPGTQMVAKLGSAEWPGRLIPFNYADDDAVIISVTSASTNGNPLSGIVSVWRRTGKVTSAVNYPGFASPYLDAVDAPSDELRKIRYAQIGNVLWLVHPNGEPVEFRRVTVSPEEYEITKLSFEVPEFPLIPGVPGVTLDTPIGGVPRLAQNSVTPVESVVLGGDNPSFYGQAENFKSANGDESHPARRWTWAITKVFRDASGRQYETKPFVLQQQIGYRHGGTVGGVNYGLTISHIFSSCKAAKHDPP